MEFDPFGRKANARQVAQLQSSFELLKRENLTVRNQRDELAAILSEDRDSEETAAKAVTEYRGSTLAREKLETLETMWAEDSILFAGTCAVAFLASSVKDNVTGKVPKDIEEMQSFQKRTSWPDWVFGVALQEQIFGCHFSEVVPNQAGNALSVLKMVDPKSMDFQKYEKQGKVYVDVDNWGDPKSYWQRPVDWDGHDLGAGKKLKQEQILHLLMRKVSDSLYGIGVIEPCRKATLRKWKIEEAFAEALHRVGFPVPITYCGDKDHPPTTTGMAKIHSTTKRFHYKSNVTLPYYNKMDFPTPRVEGIPTNLDYFVNMQIAAIGVAKAVVLGTGEGTNRATLEQLTEEGAKNIAAIHRSICAGFKKRIVPRMIDMGQLKDEVTIEFEPVSSEDKLATVASVVDMVSAGVITPDGELEVFMRQKMGLPERKGEYNPRPAQQPGFPGMAEMDKLMKRGY